MDADPHGGKFPAQKILKNLQDPRFTRQHLLGFLAAAFRELRKLGPHGPENLSQVGPQGLVNPPLVKHGERFRGEIVLLRGRRESQMHLSGSFSEKGRHLQVLGLDQLLQECGDRGKVHPEKR